MTAELIKAAIPHREPFLLVDEIVERTDTHIVCRKRFTGEEFWYRGHYPDYPLTPGVLLCEAAMQAGAVLLARHTAGQAGVPVVTRMNNVKFKAMVRPGNTVTLEVEFREQLSGAFYLDARVKKGETTCVTFDFVCKLAQLQN